MWASVAKLWTLHFVGAGNVASYFEIWCHVLPKAPREMVRKMAFVAVSWAIWNLRNQIYSIRRCLMREDALKNGISI